MTLRLIGAGLGLPQHLTLEAVKAIREADEVYIDTYTSLVDEKLIETIIGLSKGKAIKASRKMLEENSKKLLKRAADRDVCIVIPGDPLIATTHSSLVVEGREMGVEVEIAHGVSVYTAAISKSGLHVYKFGRTATIPKTRDPTVIRSVYYVIVDNMSRGLHSLILLDTSERGLTVGEALSLLLEVEREESKGAINDENLAIALARIGFEDEEIVAGRIKTILNHALPPPPHTLILPGELHFTEREYMQSYAIDKNAVETYMPPNYVRARIERYHEKTKRVIGELTRSGKVEQRFLEYVNAYVEDSRNFMLAGDYVNSLLAIGYAEGLLDALRLIGMVSFEW